MTDWNAINRQIIEEFRSNEGRVGGRFEGASMVLLTTTGARSGEQRVSPLVCLPEDDDTVYVFASKAGAPTNPAWYHNILAHPEVTVERGTERYPAFATEITGPERDAIYARQAELRPNFADYERQTTRRIPVVALRRR
jgi:deazaflavin-dependent oxidoreductase (nitroreductase family)